MHRGARGGRGAGAALDHGGQVGRGRAAAPADGGDAELGDEAVQVLRQVVGREVVVHVAVDNRREARIGDAGDGTRLAAERWRSASLISTGPVAQLRPATSTCIESSTVRAAPISVPGSMRPVSSIVTCACSGTCRPERDHGAPGAVDGGLDREQVELRLDQQEVDAAFEEAERLLLVGVAELGVGDVPEGGELGARAHGARHPARALGRGELVPYGARQLGGPPRSSRARSASPYSARTTEVEPKVSVSTTSHPTSKKERCT